MGSSGYCDLLLKAINVYGNSSNPNDIEVVKFALKALKNLCSEGGNQERVRFFS